MRRRGLILLLATLFPASYGASVVGPLLATEVCGCGNEVCRCAPRQGKNDHAGCHGSTEGSGTGSILRCHHPGKDAAPHAPTFVLPAALAFVRTAAPPLTLAESSLRWPLGARRLDLPPPRPFSVRS